MHDTYPQHFRSWVPQWLKVVVSILILIPMMLINGAYTGSTVDVSSSLGVLSEDINMAFFASAAGMAMAYPVIPIIKPVATTKTIILVVLFIQIILSFICAVTSYIEIIIICSFYIGFFKAFTLAEIISILMPIFSPSNTRNQFYSQYYPIVLILSQFSLVLTGEFAYNYEWQHMYYFMIGLILIAMVAVIICLQYGMRMIRIPFKAIQWLSFLQCSTVILCILYISIYGKTKDWFNSPDIILAFILIPIMGWMFVRKQLISENRPFVDFSILKNRNSTVIYIFCLIMMFLASYSMIISYYINYILMLNTEKLSELSIYTIQGIVVGGIISYFWYWKALRMTWLILIGFSCFAIALYLLYFNVSSTGRYEDLYLPMFLKGMGMLVLFVSFGIYAIQGLELKQLIFNAFFLIGIRSAIAPAISYGILTNWIYILQQKYTQKLADGVDATNTLINSYYTQTYSTNILQGMGTDDAQKMALQSLFNKVYNQALMISMKEILGYMLIINIIVLVIIVLYFFKYRPVKLIKAGKDMG